MPKAPKFKKIKLSHIDDPAKAADEIGGFIVDRIRRRKQTGAVVGLSGGVDSTLVAALAARAFKAHPDLKLIGYILPSKINASKDREDAVLVAQELGIRCEAYDLEPVIKAFCRTNKEAFENTYDRGNLISRVRAVVLNTKAATENKVLLGTGNKDEDYGIGYYTLFGDGAVHLSPIGALSKRLVREMATFLGFERIAQRTPTAGLEPGQTDFKDLGYDYDVVELVTEGWRQGIDSADLMKHPQIQPMIEEQIARYIKIFGKSKHLNPTDVIADIAERHYIAAVKAKLVSPEIAKITLKYR